MTLMKAIVHSFPHCYILLVNFRPTISKSSLRFSFLCGKYNWRILHLGLRLDKDDEKDCFLYAD